MMEIKLPDLAEQPMLFVSQATRRAFDVGLFRRGIDETAFRPPAALNGRIKLGGPIGVPLDRSYVEHDADLRTFVDQEAARFVYHLVHLSLTCEPEPATPRLEKAEVRLTLTSPGSAVAPIAWSMTPMRVTHSSELTTTVQLGPQLTLFGVEASLGSVERGRVEQRHEVYLEGLNPLRSDPAWELRRTRTMELRGAHRLAMVVRTERGWTTTIGGSVYGAVRGGSILRRERSDLPEPLTVSAQL